MSQLYDRYYQFIGILQANVIRLSFHWSDVNHLVTNADKWLTSFMGNERHKPFADFQHANGIRL